jgi:hypothetical protein
LSVFKLWGAVHYVLVGRHLALAQKTASA